MKEMQEREDIEMFNFAIIEMEDGTQIIDPAGRTSYNGLSPLEMMEYTEIDARLAHIERMEREQRRKEKQHRGFFQRLMECVG